MVGFEPLLNRIVDFNAEMVPCMIAMSKLKPYLVGHIPSSSIAYVPINDDVAGGGYVDMFSTPLIQVLAVCVTTNFDQGNSCEIYGSIRAFEGPRPRFALYDREPEDSETVCQQGSLSLIGPDSSAILPFTSATLDICLKDRVHGVEVVRGKLDFDAVTEDSYDRLLRTDVLGAHGFARVYYVIFQFALCGTVQVTITENDDNDDDDDDKICKETDVYGSIVACYENARGYCSDDHDVNYLETRLFEKPSDQPLRVMLGTPINLSRSVMVVPSYSSLTIRVNLWDSTGRIADDCLQFPAYILGENPIHIRTINTCVTVKVRYREAYLTLYNDRKLEDFHVAPILKKPRVSDDQQFSTPSNPRIILPVHYGGLKAEVFTIFVGGIDKKISALCGTVLIDDGSDKFSIYNRDESCSQWLSDNSLAHIEVNYRAINNSYIYIILNLRDPVAKLEVSRGTIKWNPSVLHSNDLYNKHLCCVVRGKDGYAAVHHGVFNNAFEAILEVKLFANGQRGVPINLYGTLIGHYRSRDYSTSYKKQYYTNRLFDQPRDKSMECVAGSGIALLKSIVIVPAGSSLIVDANLGASSFGNIDEAISGIAQFEIDLCGTLTKEIRGKHYWIEVSAKFKR